VFGLVARVIYLFVARILLHLLSTHNFPDSSADCREVRHANCLPVKVRDGEKLQLWQVLLANPLDDDHPSKKRQQIAGL